MKFRVLSDEINFGMSMVAHAVPARAVIPAMEGVYIETDTDHLILTATNGEMTIKSRVPAIVEEEGCGLLPAKLFGDVMRKQAAGQVQVNLDHATNATDISSLRSKTKMMGLDTEDFPEISAPSEENRLTIPCSKFKQAVGRVLFAVSQDEGRKILTGVLMEAYADQIVFVGLDGFRLALQRMESRNEIPADKKDGKISCVVPGSVMSEVTKMLPDDEKVMLNIVFSTSHIMFNFDNVTLYATLLAGEFIDYRKILPASSTTFITISCKQFNEAIDRCALIAKENKNNLISLNIKKENENGVEGQLIMTASADCGDAHEEINVGIDGKDLSISFNARYLTDMVHNIGDDMMTMCFNTNVSPCMIKPAEGDQYRFLVLPVRVFAK